MKAVALVYEEVPLVEVQCACGWVGQIYPGDPCESCGAETETPFERAARVPDPDDIDE